MRSLVIFTDATRYGDNSIAIAMLAMARGLRIVMIAATPGNVWGEEAWNNVDSLLAKLGSNKIEVCLGMPSRTFKECRPAFGHNIGLSPAPFYAGALAREVPTFARDIHVCEDLFEVIVTGNRPDLLIMGPSSVVAPIVYTHPDLVDHVGHVFLMGGAITGAGNATPTTEFNFWFDPEAAETLLASNLPITLLPLDATRNLHYPASFLLDGNRENPGGRHLRECLMRRPLMPICDELLAALIIDQSIVSQRSRIKIAVEVSPGPEYGAIRVLPDTDSRRPVDIVERVDYDHFLEIINGIFDRPGKGMLIEK